MNSRQRMKKRRDNWKRPLHNLRGCGLRKMTPMLM
ncbi:MAG: hypothetical protein ACI4AA_08900 [Lachnospiraceae bacterium]